MAKEPVSELVVMARLEKQLELLDEAARARVLAWLVARHASATAKYPPAGAVRWGGVTGGGSVGAQEWLGVD